MNSFRFLVALPIIFLGLQISADTQTEIDLAKKIAVKEYFLEQKIKAKEEILRKTERQRMASFNLALLPTPIHTCEDENGVGSELCWESCGNEGWGSSTCATRCGIDTSLGQKACWALCGKEGWGSSTCASRCGINFSGGQEGCWEQCGKEGWGSSTCTSRCGIDKSGGKRACWKLCTAEGWGSSTCTSRCGL